MLLSGCAGSGSVSGLSDVVTNTNNGQTNLDAALVLPESGDPSQLLSDALYNFNVAYGQEPTPERAVGLAMALAAKSADEIADLFGVTISRSANGKLPPAAEKLNRLLAPWRYRTAS